MSSGGEETINDDGLNGLGKWVSFKVGNGNGNGNCSGNGSNCRRGGAEGATEKNCPLDELLPVEFLDCFDDNDKGVPFMGEVKVPCRRIKEADGIIGIELLLVDELRGRTDPRFNMATSPKGIFEGAVVDLGKELEEGGLLFFKDEE